MLPLSSPYKKQKRRYFRLNVSLPIHIKLCGSDNVLRRYTSDISAGGIKFSHSKLIEIGTNLEVKIPDILGEKTIKAIVIRTEQEDIGKINKYNIVIQFVDICERTRDKIVKFILEKQRELRKKGFE